MLKKIILSLSLVTISANIFAMETTETTAIVPTTQQPTAEQTTSISQAKPTQQELDRMLFKATAQNNCQEVARCISLGANVNAKIEDCYRLYPELTAEEYHTLAYNYTRRGETPLHVALSYGAVNAVQILIKNHADVNARDANGQTPLHQVCVTFFTSTSSENAITQILNAITQILIDNGADINAKDSCKLTPLYYLVAYNNFAVVKMLIKKGATVDKEFYKKLFNNGYVMAMLKVFFFKNKKLILGTSAAIGSACTAAIFHTQLAKLLGY